MNHPIPSFSPEVRTDGAAKMSGQTTYTADLDHSDALELAFVPAKVSHARLVHVGTAAAQSVPGVRLILTGADLPQLNVGRMLLDQPVLARDRVRYHGERVAVVAAETRAAAEDAARRITVQAVSLPSMLDPLEALADDAPVLHPGADRYTYLLGNRPPVSHPNLQGEAVVEHHADDLPDAFAVADHVFEHTFTTPRQHPGYLEPHATLVQPQPDGRLRVLSTNKHPFLLRAQLAAGLGEPADRFVIEAPPIGGDFGGKGTPFDEPICSLIALRTGRAVRHVMTYDEELVGTNPRHATLLRLRTAMDKTGRLTAHDAHVVFDGGAYAAGTPMPSMVAGLPSTTAGLSTLTAYQVPSSRIVFQQVYTTSLPAGHMRAPGEVQTQFASERHIDLIAAELDIEPLALRRRNAVRGSRRGTGGERFRRPRAQAILDELQRQDTALPLATPPPGCRRGRGFALGVRELHGGPCGVRLSLTDDGRIEVLTAQPEQGGGAHSALGRIAARTVGVLDDDVVVRQGSTDEAPFDMGSAASRVTWVAGLAVQAAAGEFGTQLVQRAAELLGTDRVRLCDGAFDDGGGRPITFRSLARQLTGDPTLRAEATADGSRAADEPSAHCFSGYLIDVAVDVATGAVAVVDATIVVDVGTVINPTAHAGQLQGGFAMGVGAALMEELQVDRGAVITRTLSDYGLPTILDVPTLRCVRLDTDEGPGPFGAKSVGELSSSGVAPAIANAVAAACGAQMRDLPMTAERVFLAFADGVADEPIQQKGLRR